ncbi:DNA glycosylase AlkZ-like family protein [Paeniglutamicibacter sp. R2-26]|uniref:DNA glycosylase AlkZ-like family protein n=1 Tax=Paeniglutamicibacter sp. R2-26 TaxID=3144417 RepID=UPI003EE43266
MLPKTDVPTIPVEQLTPEFLRAWSWHRQGLDGSLAGQGAARVLDRAGWARSIGGANTYLSLFARAGIGRESADQLVATQAIHELPTARGCTYVLPAGDFAWGLQLGGASAEAAVKVLLRLGVGREEVERLAESVMEALQHAKESGRPPMDPRELKDVVGDQVRNLGEAGKKKGATTTLPAALGLLQAHGRIRRIPVNGRLDQQRYSYVAWELPATGENDATVRARMVERFLGWTGGATTGQIRWFTAFTVAQTKAALAAIGAVAVGTAGEDILWMMPRDVAFMSTFEVPDEEDVQLLAGSDSLVLLRRNSADAFDAVGRAAVAGMSGSALAADLSDHPIVDRGRIIGLWQYDPEKERIAWWTFEPASEKVLKRIHEVQAWIAEDLGDFRSFSLDSPKSREKNIVMLDRLRTA